MHLLSYKWRIKPPPLSGQSTVYVFVDRVMKSNPSALHFLVECFFYSGVFFWRFFFGFTD